MFDNLPERQRVAAEGEAAWEQGIRALPDLQQPQMAWLPLLFVERALGEELAPPHPFPADPNHDYHGLVVSVVGRLPVCA